MRKAIVLLLILIGLPCVALSGAYWWANVPPRRPQGVARSAVFLWTGHLGLPAPKHGTRLEWRWADTASAANKCRLTEMDGKPDYEGVFVADKGAALVPQSDLRIDIETTSNRTFWVRLNESVAAPLVFLQNGAVSSRRKHIKPGWPSWSLFDRYSPGSNRKTVLLCGRPFGTAFCCISETASIRSQPVNPCLIQHQEECHAAHGIYL